MRSLGSGPGTWASGPGPVAAHPLPAAVQRDVGRRHELEEQVALVTGSKRSLIRKLTDTIVYAPQIRARLGTTAHFCRVVDLGNPVAAHPLPAAVQ